MRICLLTSFLSLHVFAVAAFNVQFRQTKRSSLHQRSQATHVSVTHPGSVVNDASILAAGGGTGGDNGLDISSVRDLIYLANVTLGGIEYPLQLDTGSSDLWVKGPSTPFPNSEQTSISYNITYGIGWVFGNVAYIAAEFAGMPVPRQAFLDASQVDNPALGYGATGILGLGFTSLSTIDALINGTDASSGRSFLYNLFAVNPSQPNFIAFAMNRAADPSDDVEGSFAIGEYVPKYAGVADTPVIPTFPPHAPTRWNVLLESFIVNGKTVNVSTTVSGAPSDTAVILLDSGTSYTYAPADICDAIYKDIPGATLDEILGQWIVPCDVRIDMAIQIGGRVFPIHPLDVSPHGINDPSTCVGSFVPQIVTVGSGQFDWLIGDNVLRSVYSLYDFGDFDASGAMGDPYIKLLSIIDPNQAAQDFHAVRGGTPGGNITYNASNTTGTSGKLTFSLSEDVARSVARFGQFFPIILGILALNVLVILSLGIVGIVVFCRGRGKCCGGRGGVGAMKKRKMARGETPSPLTLRDMPMNPSINVIDSDNVARPSSHVYEPVSLTAATEDTVFSPMRKSHNFDGESYVRKSHAFDQETLVRKSQNLDAEAYVRQSQNVDAESLMGALATELPPSPMFGGFPVDPSRRASTARSENFVFVPPSPGFRMVDNERPRSIG